MTRRRAAIALGLALAASALVACGLPKDSAPRVIARDKVPFDLLGPSTTTPSDTGATGMVVDVWFVAGQRLRAVARTVTDTQPRTVLDALLKGVAAGDAQDLSSAIPQNTTVTSTELSGGTLTITLSKDIVNVTGPEQTKAFAQLTFTALSAPGVTGVRFRALDESGQPQDLEPTTDTGSKQGPLTKADFSTLAPLG